MSQPIRVLPDSPIYHWIPTSENEVGKSAGVNSGSGILNKPCRSLTVSMTVDADRFGVVPEL